MMTRNISLCLAAALMCLSLMSVSCGSAEVSPLLSEVADMTLCYGGSAHRSPYRWDKDRFATHVSYIDSAGTEHWLFESFLAIEFVDTAHEDQSYACCAGRPSANKDSWERILDYWFEEGYGFDALDEAVGETARRIGAPPAKRLAVMSIPDPIVHLRFEEDSSTTVYWGELEGRQLDFAVPADRIAAEKWYVDETIRRFKAKKYQNIDLAGFYIISEDLACELDGVTYGWSAPLKHFPDYLPATSEYIHRQGLEVCWIPYFQAAGYQLTDFYGIDLAFMQPNRFWHPEYDQSILVEITREHGLGMELELDDELFGPDAEQYRSRVRDYFALARESGIYGTRPFAMYAGTDTFCRLAASQNQEDRALFRELCDFLIHNPLKNKIEDNE